MTPDTANLDSPQHFIPYHIHADLLCSVWCRYISNPCKLIPYLYPYLSAYGCYNDSEVTLIYMVIIHWFQSTTKIRRGGYLHFWYFFSMGLYGFAILFSKELYLYMPLFTTRWVNCTYNYTRFVRPSGSPLHLIYCCKNLWKIHPHTVCAVFDFVLFVYSIILWN